MPLPLNLELISGKHYMLFATKKLHLITTKNYCNEIIGL